MTGWDGTIHMSEETQKSRNAVPHAMFWSEIVNIVLAFAVLIPFLFVSGSLEEALSVPIPMFVIFQKITGSQHATTAIISLITAIVIFTGINSTTTVSRLTWAWARDGGLHPWFARVSGKSGVPVQAVLLPTLLVMLLALLNLGSPAALGAVAALTSMALTISYGIAIACMLYARWHKGSALTLGTWNLGRYGPWVNGYALIHSVYVAVFLPFPQTLPVTASNMNYAGPLFVLCVLFACVTWYAWARKNWRGLSTGVIEYVLASEK